MLNEFRQDLVSGDWVLFSIGRAKGHIGNDKREKFYQPKNECPFEDFKASGNDNPLMVFYKGERVGLGNFESGQWSTVVIPNKFPAVKAGICEPPIRVGPFNKIGATGFHELVVTKDHDRGLCCFSTEETAEIITVYRDRYREISKQDCGQYILIFHNRGPTAGATIFHNHSQILSTPILPPDVLRSIKGSEDYHKKYGKKVHEVMLEWEMKEGKRIVYDNDGFVAFCPFVSKTPYEVRIFPKKSSSKFSDLDDGDIKYLARTLNAVLQKTDKLLDEPDFNFYIHTAPIRNNDSNLDFYHWHMEVVPRVKTYGGLEFGADIYVNEIDPDKAAEELRNV